MLVAGLATALGVLVAVELALERVEMQSRPDASSVANLDLPTRLVAGEGHPSGRWRIACQTRACFADRPRACRARLGR